VRKQPPERSNKETPKSRPEGGLSVFTPAPFKSDLFSQYVELFSAPIAPKTDQSRRWHGWACRYPAARPTA